MPDVLSPEQRRRVMRRVRNKNTDVELRLRHGLYSFGLRYRLHDKTLPGTPDLVFAKFRTAVFVHGCFWHRHSCPRASVPVTRHDFWSEKLAVNVARDKKKYCIPDAIGLARPGRVGVRSARPRGAGVLFSGGGYCQAYPVWHKAISRICGENGRTRYIARRDRKVSNALTLLTMTSYTVS